MKTTISLLNSNQTPINLYNYLFRTETKARKTQYAIRNVKNTLANENWLIKLEFWQLKESVRVSLGLPQSMEGLRLGLGLGLDMNEE